MSSTETKQAATSRGATRFIRDPETGEMVAVGSLPPDRARLVRDALAAWSRKRRGARHGC